MQFMTTARPRGQWAVLTILIGTLLSSCNSSPQDRVSSQPTANHTTTPENNTAMKTILFYGNSITAGYGLDPNQAFPAHIQQRLDSLGLPYQVVNAGLSGETTTGGLTRLDWVLDQQPVDVFVLELGANDGLRGINPEESQKNLQAILNRVKDTYPQAQLVITGMESPPNMGSDYTQQFRSMFRELAQANPQATFVPFILEGVAGNPALNLGDGIHPTAEGHRLVAQHLWSFLAPLFNPATAS